MMDKQKIYPRSKNRETVYLKNVITDPSIIVGDYTMYNDFVNDPVDFQKNNVLYHYPINHDRLIIGKFCSIACGARFLFNSANHSMTSLATYPFPIFFEEWGLDVSHITEAWDNKGEYLFPTDVEVNMWDVNVDFSDRDVIALYHAHGKSEQFHSEIKTDMNLERFPSGKFSTNELVLELAMPAYNILRMISDESIGPGHPMRHPVKRRRIGTVIKNLVMMACHITMHARKSRIGLGGSNVWRRTFQKVSLSFSCL